MKKIVFLDFGGTIDGDGAHWSVQYARSFAAAGMTVSDAKLRAAFFASDRALLDDPRIDRLGLDGHVHLQLGEMMRRLDGPDDAALERVADHWLDRARSRIAGARRALERHAGRFRYGMISNFTGNLPLILAEEKLAHLFECVVVSEAEKTRKPEPEIFRRALARMSGRAVEATMIGDSLPNDMRGAKAAGLTTIWVREDADALAAPADGVDHAARSVAEALDLLAATA